MIAMSAEGPVAQVRPELQPETRALRVLQTALSEAELALARRMRLNVTDLSAMAHLSFAERPLGTGELSGRLGLSPGATTELVDRLERAGHVLRHRDETDRRRVRLTPSPDATAEVLRRLGTLFETLDGILVDFSDDERATVQRYLAAVTDAYRRWSVEESDE
jgi:DNA-binding MarR family transcriptional regulator